MSEENELDREGTFRGRIISYGLRQASESQAVAISSRVAIDEQYNFETEEWEDWRGYSMFTWSSVWIVTKKGLANDKAVESLVKSAGWGGSLQEVLEQTWMPSPCQFVVKPNVFNDSTTYPVAFLNPYDSTPGGTGLSNIDDAKARALQAKFGTAFKALAANVKRNTPPSDRPKSPQPASVGNGAASKQEIPF